MLNTGPHSCIGGASNYLAPALLSLTIKTRIYHALVQYVLLGGGVV